MRLSKKRKETLTVIKNNGGLTIGEMKSLLELDKDSINEDKKLRSCLKKLLIRGIVWRYQDLNSFPAFRWEITTLGVNFLYRR